MRIWAAALLLMLLAAGSLHAAKPVAPIDGPADTAADRSARWRGQGISLCVGELRAIPGLTPDDLESICGCAVDRHLEAQRSNPNPQLQLRGPLEAQMVACTARLRPERAGDVARWRAAAQNAAPPPVTPPMPEIHANDFKPLDDNEAPADGDGASGESGGGFWAWVQNLAWPAWLTGGSVLFWVAIGIFLIGLLILRFRGRDPRKDLAAPPSHMRRGAPPQPPRRPDLPR